MAIIRKTSRFSKLMKVMLVALVMSVVLGSFYVPPAATPVQAAVEEDASKRQTDNEIAGASKDAKDKLSGFTGGVSSFWEGIKNWIGGIFKGLDDSIQGMFGGEEDAGMGAFFGTVVWAIIIITFLFVVAFAYNIIKGMFGGGESSVSERYRKQ